MINLQKCTKISGKNYKNANIPSVSGSFVIDEKYEIDYTQ